MGGAAALWTRDGEPPQGVSSWDAASATARAFGDSQKMIGNNVKALLTNVALWSLPMIDTAHYTLQAKGRLPGPIPGAGKN